MAISKLIFNGVIQMDVTGTTAGTGDVASGETFVLADGTTGTGSLTPITVSSLSVTNNGTYTAPTGTAYSPVTVNVSGGASNFVHGEFTTQSTAGVQIVNVSYNGSGYPIMAYIVVKGGAYVSGTTWYDSLQRYAVGVWAMSKSIMSSTPTYSTSGTENQAVVLSAYKNSDTSPTTYGRALSMDSNIFSSSNAAASTAICVRFNGNTTFSVWVNTSGYTLHPGIDYEYFIAYSS